MTASVASEAKPSPEAAATGPEPSTIAPANPPAVPPNFKLFGWAGLLLAVPEDWRLTKIDGTYDNGALMLGDAERPRLEIVWGRIKRKRFDPQRLVDRRLAKAVDRHDRNPDAGRIRELTHPTLGPISFYANDSGQRDHVVAYDASTHRLMELVYHRKSAKSDPLFSHQVLPTLRDQPVDQPQGWAFFRCSFMAPTGFVHEEAELNLGDMQVKLLRRRERQREAWIRLRQLYPAKAALTRQGFDKWLIRAVEPHAKLYRFPSRGFLWSWRPLPEPAACPRGEAHVVPGPLKWKHRPLRWRLARYLRVALVNDEAMDRLLLLEVGAASANEAVELSEQVFSGVHWANPSNAAETAGPS